MSVTASCGHVLKEFEGEDASGLGTTVSIKASDNYGKCVITTTLCDICLIRYREHNMILDTEEDCNNWMIMTDKQFNRYIKINNILKK